MVCDATPDAVVKQRIFSGQVCVWVWVAEERGVVGPVAHLSQATLDSSSRQQRPTPFNCLGIIIDLLLAFQNTCHCRLLPIR